MPFNVTPISTLPRATGPGRGTVPLQTAHTLLVFGELTGQGGRLPRLIYRLFNKHLLAPNSLSTAISKEKHRAMTQGLNGEQQVGGEELSVWRSGPSERVREFFSLLTST